MISDISHTNVYVTDQQRALEFYTQKLGFEVRADGRVGEFRWITVGPKEQPDMELILSPISEQMFGDHESVAQFNTLVEKGEISGPVLECENIQGVFLTTYQVN